MPFTPEELDAMRKADEEIEREFRLTPEDLAESSRRDRDAVVASMPPERRRRAAYWKARYEANREKCLAYQKAYREANREKIAANQKAYREAKRH